MKTLNGENKEIYNDIIVGIKATQEKHTELEKKYDGLVKTEIKDNSDKIMDLMETVQKAEAEKKALQDQIDKIVASIKRSPLGQDGKTPEIVDSYKGAFRDYARKGKIISTELITQHCEYLVNQFASCEKDAVKSDLVKTLSVNSNPDGGYLVLPERIQNFTITRDFETSPVRQVANIIPTLAESVEIVIDDDESASGGWVSEEQGRGDTDTAKVGLLSITAHEQFAQPKVTQKLLDDASINIEAYLTRKTEDILIRTENTAFVVGDGAGKPRGFLNYPAWAVNGVYEQGKLEQIDSGTNGLFVANTIKDLQNALHEFYQPNAVFMIKRASWGEIIKLKDGEDRFLLDTNSFKEGDSRILLGKSVIFADDIASVATDALAMVYGDFSMGYTIVDRVGIRVLRDPFTNKPFIKFYTTKRVGGAVTNYEALKIYKLAA